MINQNEMSEISELITNDNLVETNLAETSFALLVGQEREFKSTPQCPECRMKMIRLGVCFSCPECGYGSCG
jgi:hypothetical protein